MSLPPFVPLLDENIKEFGLVKSAILGAIWLLQNRKAGVCNASNSTIGKMIGVDRSTVSKNVKELIEANHITDHTPNRQKAPHDIELSVDLINRFNGVSVDTINNAGDDTKQSVDTINTGDNPSVDTINSSRKSVDLITQEEYLKKKNTSPKEEEGRKKFEQHFINQHGSRHLQPVIDLIQHFAISVQVLPPITYSGLKSWGEPCYEMLRMADFDLGKAKPLLETSISINRNGNYAYAAPKSVVETFRREITENKNGAHKNATHRNNTNKTPNRSGKQPTFATGLGEATEAELKEAGLSDVEIREYLAAQST